ncbi:MAG TPA: DUF2550 family protein [Mycobacteriales bacterium]|jgi:hypothetical protein|nr:DUF2550 family protein [Mycobacteriales bacterium]
MLARDIELVVASVVAALLLGFVLVQVRRSVLFRRGATVACALRHDPHRHWQGGVARFDPDALRAYRIVGLGIRPYAELPRACLSVGDRRAPTPADRQRLMHDPVVLVVSNGASELEMAVGSDALPGLLAWVEGRPNT